MMCVNFLNAGSEAYCGQWLIKDLERRGGGEFKPTGGGIVLYSIPDCSYFPHEIEMVQNWVGGRGRFEPLLICNWWSSCAC